MSHSTLLFLRSNYTLYPKFSFVSLYPLIIVSIPIFLVLSFFVSNNYHFTVSCKVSFPPPHPPLFSPLQSALLCCIMCTLRSCRSLSGDIIAFVCAKKIQYWVIDAYARPLLTSLPSVVTVIVRGFFLDFDHVSANGQNTLKNKKTKTKQNKKTRMKTKVSQVSAF